MSLHPATYVLRIPQRASLREVIRVPFDGSGCEAFVEVWDSDKRRRKLLDLTVEWVDRNEEWDPLDPTKIRATLALTATWEETRAVTKDGYWDLLWVWPDEERDYVLEGPAVVNRGVTEALEVTP